MTLVSIMFSDLDFYGQAGHNILMEKLSSQNLLLGCQAPTALSYCFYR